MSAMNVLCPIAAGLARAKFRDLRSARFLAMLLCGLGLSGCATSQQSPAAEEPAPYVEPEVMPRVEDLPPRAPLSFEEELAKADRMRDSGQQQESIWRYLRALQLNFNSPIPRQRIAYVHLAKDVDRAEQIFRRLVKERPAMPSLRVGLGLAEFAAGKHEQATETLKFALALDPDSAVALTALGLMDDARGDYEEARRHYAEALILEPSRYEIQNDIGMSYMMDGQFEEAVEAFNSAIFLDPNDPVVHNNLGFVLGKLRRYDDALESFKTFSPEGEAISNTGSMCFLNGDYRCAIDYYERALLMPVDDREQLLSNLRAAENAYLQETGGAADAAPPSGAATP
ncbi:MAG: tetratricopeptide repeat protein [Deltaproteobacteria bacterium]|nr:tetratricopeptide repeat protein [Deltaproteobacteria bacterium]